MARRVELFLLYMRWSIEYGYMARRVVSCYYGGVLSMAIREWQGFSCICSRVYNTDVRRLENL